MKYATPEAHRRRLLGLGWEHVRCVSMKDYYRHHLSRAERERVDAIEDFDEFEEWHLKCVHYILAVGLRGQLLSEVLHQLRDTPSVSMSEAKLSNSLPDGIAPQWQDVPLLRRSAPGLWGHASAVLDGGRIFVFGGYGGKRHVRLNELHVASVGHGNSQDWFWSVCPANGKPPAPRMHHTCTALNESGAQTGG